MAGIDSLRQSEDDFTSCVVCKWTYTPTKLLPCYHPVCDRCQATKRVIVCPLCVLEPNLEDVPLRENILQPVWKSYRAVLDPKPCVVCTVHGKTILGTHVCINCSSEDFLCDQCVKSHSATRATRDHKPVPIAKLDPVEWAKELQGRGVEMCPKHNKEKEFVCEDCDVLVCQKCLLLDHHTHGRSFLVDTVTTRRQQLEKLTDELKVAAIDKKEECDSLQERITKRLTEYETSGNSLNQHSEVLVALVETQMHDGIERYKKKFADEIRRLESLNKASKMELIRLENSLKYAKYFEKYSSKADLLQTCDDIYWGDMLKVAKQRQIFNLPGTTKLLSHQNNDCSHIGKILFEQVKLDAIKVKHTGQVSLDDVVGMSRITGIDVDEDDNIAVSVEDGQVILIKEGEGEIIFSDGESKITDIKFHRSHIFVLDANKPGLLQLEKNGTFSGKQTFHTLKPSDELHLAVSDDSIFISSALQGKIFKMRHLSADLKVFAQGTKEIPIGGPTHLQVTNNNDVIASVGILGYVYIFDSKGALKQRIEGTDLDDFFAPQGLCVDNRGRLYVCDSVNERVDIWVEDSDTWNVIDSIKFGEGKTSPFVICHNKKGSVCVSHLRNNKPELSMFKVAILQ